MDSDNQCPVSDGFDATPSGRHTHQDWWPNQLKLSPLERNRPSAIRWTPSFNYAEEFMSLDLDALKKDVLALMTSSQEWWPADYGHYGPFFIRMAWHSAGTYRIHDGRGGGESGTQRFAPLNSWPDNVNLDKARRLLWPIKQKYGRKISWADLMILAGTLALESMGMKTYGFAGGREDVFDRDEDIYWGPEDVWLGDERYSGDRELERPLGAVQMGLIYVNPEGPNGTPDPLAAARDIRETFRRMAMNDEETVALIAGGHTFGKAHGAADRARTRRRRARSCRARRTGTRLEEQLMARATPATRSRVASKARGRRAPSRGTTATSTRSSATSGSRPRARPARRSGSRRTAAAPTPCPTPTIPSKSHAPVMFTTDLALRMDPIYEPISKRFHEHPDEFELAFAKAWYKLTHRDMGPRSRCLGPWVPAEAQIWQDPVPEATARADRRDADRRAQGTDPRVGAERVATRRDGVGVGRDVPRHRQARRRQRRAHSPCAPEGLGGQRFGRSLDGAAHPRGHPERLQRSTRRGVPSHWPTSSCSADGRGRASGEERRTRRRGSLHARSHGRAPRGHRRRVLRRAGADLRRVPQLSA